MKVTEQEITEEQANNIFNAMIKEREEAFIPYPAFGGVVVIVKPFASEFWQLHFRPHKEKDLSFCFPITEPLAKEFLSFMKKVNANEHN